MWLRGSSFFLAHNPFFSAAFRPSYPLKHRIFRKLTRCYSVITSAYDERSRSELIHFDTRLKSCWHKLYASLQVIFLDFNLIHRVKCKTSWWKFSRSLKRTCSLLRVTLVKILLFMLTRTKRFVIRSLGHSAMYSLLWFPETLTAFLMSLLEVVCLIKHLPMIYMKVKFYINTLLRLLCRK